MRYTKWLAILVIGGSVLAGCGFNSASEDSGSDDTVPTVVNYRNEMRTFVQEISGYSKSKKPSFIIIPQNGHELITENGFSNGPLANSYLQAIDGMGREDLFYGYTGDDQLTPTSERTEISAFLDRAVQEGKRVLVTDYVFTQAKVDDSYSQNAAKGYISFAAHRRALDQIPSYPSPLAPYAVHTGNVATLSQAKNFLYIINPSAYSNKNSFIAALQATNYDILIIDLFFNASTPLSQSDVSSLKTKQNGGTRLVIAYMSIGEAENYRFYWKQGWKPGSPSWLREENPEWPGNYAVRYWHPDWKKIIYGNSDAYLDRIVAAGFDGVYLDKIDVFEHFEK